MKSARALAVFLACAAMAASAALHAQGRGPATRAARSSEQQVEKPPLAQDEAIRARKTAEMEAWLGRLAGQYRVDAKLSNVGESSKTNGTAVCDRFGSGPGVRCVIQGIHRNELERDRGTLPLLYFGINPDNLEIQLVMVDKEQVGTLSGVLAGDTVDFADNWKVCHKLWTSCWAADEITAKPAGEIFMKIGQDLWAQGSRVAPVPHLTKSGHSFELEMLLYREPLVDAQVPQNAP